MKITVDAKQKGFTLIELIVVIVILGILAATALPKFADFGRDARSASLRGAQGAIAATSAMAHGKYLVASTPPANITVEGSVVTFSLAFASGYPQADGPFLIASGITTANYITNSSTAGVPGTPGSLSISPAGTVATGTCNLTYTEPASATAAPTLVVTSTGC